MRELLESLSPPTPIEPLAIFGRLILATAMGWLVSLIYRRTQGSNGADGLQTTLVMLAVLIAMVTQVIGDNVARAFSLVGALSIVRFRTVVRDTRDTAFVIFSVVVGMSVGSQNPWVALIGIAVGGATAFALAAEENGKTAGVPIYSLRVRGSAGANIEGRLAGKTFRLMALESTKLGTLLEATYEIHLKAEDAPALLRAITETDGVQEVRLQRAGETE
jgi:hypothetical protein